MDSELSYSSKVAVLSDVHGNRWALEAVLADINRRGVIDIVNLGDTLYGPLDPSGCADMIIGLRLPTVRGNQDRIVVDGSNAADSPTLQYVRSNLRQEHLKWLESLDLTAVVHGTFFLCHGTPADDEQYLLNDVRESGVHLASPADLETSLSNVGPPVLLCGHDHAPRTLRLPNGKLLVNPGSVGLQAYDDDAPHPHVMQTGTPHARYSLVYGGAHGWVVEDIAVPYDWDAASRVALENGRPDWATWLASGRADTA